MMRTLLADRIQNGFALVLLAYLLLLQAVLAAMAHGAMAGAGAGDGPQLVICSSFGTPQDAATQGVVPDDGERRAPVDCPCATACRLAGTLVPVTLDIVVTLAHPIRPAETQRYAALPVLLPAVLHRRTPEARAPPHFSI